MFGSSSVPVNMSSSDGNLAELQIFMHYSVWTNEVRAMLFNCQNRPDHSTHLE